MTHKKCEINNQLFDKLLSQDSIHPDSSDMEHITNCAECNLEWHQTGKLDILLEKEKSRILSDIPSITTSTLLRHNNASKNESFGFINMLSLNNLLSFSFALILIVLTVTRFYSPSEQRTVEIPERFVIASGQLMSGNKLFSSETADYDISGKLLTVNKTATVMLQNKIAIAFSEAKGNLENTKLELAYGKVLVWVKKKGTNFSVKTPTSTFKVIGTKFFVHHNENNETTLEVLSGRVLVTTIKNEIITANKDAIVKIGKNGKIVFCTNANSNKSLQLQPLDHIASPNNVNLKPISISTSLESNETINSDKLARQDSNHNQSISSNTCATEGITSTGEEFTIDQTEKNSFLDSIMATERN